jgi:hypothetical protein
VQTHMWAISTALLPMAFLYAFSAGRREMLVKNDYIEHVEVGMSRFFLLGGYDIASLDYLLSKRTPVVPPGLCDSNAFANVQTPAHPDSIFFKFGGEVMRTRCDERRSGRSTGKLTWLDDVQLAIGSVQRATQKLSADMGELLMWPEDLCVAAAAAPGAANVASVE